MIDSLNFKSLHDKALSLALIYKKTESDLLVILGDIDKSRGYLNLKYKSLFEYCVQGLGLPDGTSYNLITVARKSNEVPELQNAVVKGTLSVSKAKKIASVITKENKEHWIGLAQTLPRLALEKEVAKVSPKEATPERAKYVSEDRLLLNLGVSEKLMTKIQRIQDLESKRRRSNASLEDALDAMSDEYLNRNDPVVKAKRGTAKQAGKQAAQQFPGTVPPEIPFQRSSLKAQLSHQVNLRDRDKCQQVHNNKICGDSRFTEIHHIVPISRGGRNELTNLKTLCSVHHRMLHLNTKETIG